MTWAAQTRLCDILEGWKMGGRFKRKGTYIYLWPIYIDVWQGLTQYCKAVILQLIINKLKMKSYLILYITVFILPTYS